MLKRVSIIDPERTPQLDFRLQAQGIITGYVGADGAAGDHPAGRDDAFKAFFTFVGLPAGEYQLSIDAIGYLPYSESHFVAPGRHGLLRPVVLTPRQ